MDEVKVGEQKQATDEQVREAVRPETAEPCMVKVGDREISIAPLAYRWQSLYWKYALPV